MADPSAVPGVDLIAHPTGDTLEAAPTNSALQLADSLREVEPEVGSFVDAYANKVKLQQQQRAQADALRTSGKAFADAVRDGTIEPTQNPWYMKAYNEAAAKVSARPQIESIILQSQTWAERNSADTTAYDRRLASEIGAVAAHYNGDKDSLVGFQTVAQPLMDQAQASNVGYNVTRIQQQKVQDATTLATQAVLDTIKANPRATPDQIFNSLEPSHQTWVGTGGTETAWRLLVHQAVVGAGANLGDSTLLDILKQPYLGGPPIANQADETGKPVGLELDDDKRRIAWGLEAELNAAYKAHQAQVAAEGTKVDAWAQATYGNDYAFGKIPLSQLQTEGIAQGFSGQAIMWAADKQGEALRGAAGYSQGQTDVYSNDPAVQQRILGLNQEATQRGLNPHLIGELQDMVGRQQITLAMSLSIMDRAQGQSHFAESEANSRAMQAASLARQDASLKLQTFSMIGDAAKQAKGEAGNTLESFGFNPTSLSAKSARDLADTVDNAAMAHANAGLPAASVAARTAAVGWVTNYIATHPRPHSSGAGPAPVTLQNPNSGPAQ